MADRKFNGELIQYQTEDSETVTRAIEAPSAVERHFLEATQAVKQIGAQRKRGGSDD